MNIALSGATLYANNQIVSYTPNTLTYDLGTPERLVSPQVIGGGAVTNVVTEDYSTSKSMLKFDVKTTSENEEIVLNLIDSFDQNVMKVVSAEGKTRIFQNAAVVNKPEFDTGSDGVISVEMESSPAVVA